MFSYSFFFIIIILHSYTPIFSMDNKKYTTIFSVDESDSDGSSTKSGNSYEAQNGISLMGQQLHTHDAWLQNLLYPDSKPRHLTLTLNQDQKLVLIDQDNPDSISADMTSIDLSIKANIYPNIMKSFIIALNYLPSHRKQTLVCFCKNIRPLQKIINSGEEQEIERCITDPNEKIADFAIHFIGDVEKHYSGACFFRDNSLGKHCRQTMTVLIERALSKPENQPPSPHGISNKENNIS